MSNTILLLDDEPVVRNAACAALRGAGFTVIEASTPEDALSFATSDAVSIALFITNHRLPGGVTGREVAEKILKVHPTMRVLHISGYPERELRHEGSISPGGSFLGKPFYPRQLVGKVNEIL